MDSAWLRLGHAPKVAQEEEKISRWTPADCIARKSVTVDACNGKKRIVAGDRGGSLRIFTIPTHSDPSRSIPTQHRVGAGARIGWDGMGWDGMGWDGVGAVGLDWIGMGWDGMEWEGGGHAMVWIELNRMGWGGAGGEGRGMAWIGMGWDGMWARTVIFW